MAEYFDVKIKNHKKLDKKIIYIEYNREDFFPTLEKVSEMIQFYIDTLLKYEDKKIVVFNLDGIQNYSKKVVWEGASIFRKHEKTLLENLDSVYIINSNNIANFFLNIVMKETGNKIDTKFVLNFDQVVSDLSKRIK